MADERSERVERDRDPMDEDNVVGFAEGEEFDEAEESDEEETEDSDDENF